MKWVASWESVVCSKGSVRKSGDRLRVTVQLIDVATGFHKWSEKFERDAGDVFAMQDEIAEKVATLLRGGELSHRERRAVHRQPTAIETYECFLRGRQRMHTMQQPQMDEARALYQRAIELDAEYAPAWAGLAMLHALLYEWWGSNAEDLAEADRASRVAMELAPELADANLARGYTLSNLRRYEEANRHFEAAARINPNLFDAYYYYGRAAFAAGDIEKSIELWRKAGDVRREDFESPLLQAQSMRKLRPPRRIAGREPRSGTARRKAAWSSIRRTAAYCHSAPARCTTTASPSARSNGRAAPKRSIQTTWASSSTARCLRARIGLTEEALDLLDRMFGKGWGKKDWVENDPDYDSLRGEPRFIAMLAKLK